MVSLKVINSPDFQLAIHSNFGVRIDASALTDMSKTKSLLPADWLCNSTAIKFSPEENAFGLTSKVSKTPSFPLDGA